MSPTLSFHCLKFLVFFMHFLTSVKTSNPSRAVFAFDFIQDLLHCRQINVCVCSTATIEADADLVRPC